MIYDYNTWLMKKDYFIFDFILQQVQFYISCTLRKGKKPNLCEE